jgi:uncharacterized protein (TIGR02145 family)
VEQKGGQKYCYKEDAANCVALGGLYQWAQAMNLDPSCNTAVCALDSPHRGLCPSGWHVPTNDEWSTLKSYTKGGDDVTILQASDETVPDGYSWDSKVGHGNGTDTYGFTALAGGGRYYDGYCPVGSGTTSYYCWGVHYRGEFWSTEQDATTAYFQDISDDHDTMTTMRDGKKTYGYSVRCVQD